MDECVPLTTGLTESLSIKKGLFFNIWSHRERIENDSKQREAGSSSLFRGLSMKRCYLGHYLILGKIKTIHKKHV